MSEQFEVQDLPLTEKEKSDFVVLAVEISNSLFGSLEGLDVSRDYRSRLTPSFSAITFGRTQTKNSISEGLSLDIEIFNPTSEPIYAEEIGEDLVSHTVEGDIIGYDIDVLLTGIRVSRGFGLLVVDVIGQYELELGDTFDIDEENEDLEGLENHENLLLSDYMTLLDIKNIFNL